MTINIREMHPKAQGERSESAVIHEFVKHGISVLEPFGDNERYDIVIEEEGTFYRVQIKTGRIENGRVQFETRSTGTLTRRIEKEGYTGEIDVFAVYSPKLEETFIVPVGEAPETSMGIRIEQADKQSPNINWAEDYRLSSWIKSIQE